MPAVPLLSTISGLLARTETGSSVSDEGLQVVCAWPVSGQYGPGSRVLYYALVAACIFARKAEWLRNPCLAAALLLPAVAALHAIVLAVTNVPDAVDMDIYGAFQVCAIGVLAAPVTVNQSQTYFNDPGRNTIFVWSSLIFAGLVSLTVQFYRSIPSHCKEDDHGNPISPDPSLFPYGGTRCGLICSVSAGPHSPIRGGSANNIYVIPAPDKLSFNTAMLLSAACCIPTILLLINMWLKILETNAKKVHSGDNIQMGEMKKANRAITFIRKYVEVPFFAAAILAILALGETNLFSEQVRHQTEPVANIGQWGPIVGTGLAVIGSLYVLLAQAVVREQQEPEPPPKGAFTRRIARKMMGFSNWIGIPKHDRFDTGSDFREVRQRIYPNIPGEEHRVDPADLHRIQSSYDQHPDSSSIRSALRSRSRSRANSARSAMSGAAEGEPNSPAAVATPNKRRPTLEVPSSSHHRTLSAGSQNSITNQETPVIRVTSMEQTVSPEQSPVPDATLLDRIPTFPQLPESTLERRE